jgi:hypothetical protein
MRATICFVAVVCAIGLSACTKHEQQQHQPNSGAVGTSGQPSQGTTGTTEGTPGSAGATGSHSPAVTLSGQVLSGVAPVANSAVTLWAAGAGDPAQLGQVRSGDDGRFTIGGGADRASDASLYLIAKGGTPATNKAGGDNPAITLIAVLGPNPPTNVTINEMTTVASVWTHNQFIDGTAITGQPLQLKIAAGNVPSFVDLATGGWGPAIQDPLNSGQTTTMANFATLADALAGCVGRVVRDACNKLYGAAAGPSESETLNDTLTAAESIAKYPWYQPARVHALLATFYPIEPGKTMRPVPYMPYLSVAPSAWVLPLKFDGGGYRAGGKAMFDSEGNLWVGDNFTVGWQAQDALWQGNATKFDPNGKPLSPITTGFAGGGMQGGTFGAAVDAKDNAWLTSYGGKSIAVFDKSGKPLTPPEGITFNGQLGLMQGIIATPGGDVWALGISKRQLVLFPRVTGPTAASSARPIVPSRASRSRRRSTSLLTVRIASGCRTVQTMSSGSQHPIPAGSIALASGTTTAE